MNMLQNKLLTTFSFQKFWHANIFKYFWFIKSVYSYYSSFVDEKNRGINFLKTTQKVHKHKSWDSKFLFLLICWSKQLETFSEKLNKYLLKLFYFNLLNIDHIYKVTLYRIFY